MKVELKLNCLLLFLVLFVFTVSCLNFGFSRKRYELLVRKFFIQLTEGCGDSGCTNLDCATGCGISMDQNQAAARALSIVQSRNKNVTICLPKDRAIPQSNSKVPPTLNSTCIPAVSSSSSGDAGMSEKESQSNAEPLEPMETTDSYESIPMEKSHSACDSAASSGVVQMTSSNSFVSLNDAPLQQSLIPSDIGASSSNDENNPTDPTGGHNFSRGSGVIMPTFSGSNVGGGDVVRMDLSPPVPSNPSFTVSSSLIPKDGLLVSLPNSNSVPNYTTGQ